MAAKQVLGAMGGWLAAAGLACGQAGPQGAGMPPGGMPGPGFGPPGGGYLETPPGNPALIGYPGADPSQQGGPPLGELPPVPQAWMNSAFNPAPTLVMRTEALFWRSNMLGSQPLARQADIVSGGTFALVDRGVDPESKMFLTPKMSIERHWPVGQRSLELGGWAGLGPNKTERLGNADFPLFTGPLTVNDEDILGILTNLPAAFPLVSDLATVKLRQNAGNVELMWWRHCSPRKGAVADFAWGWGGRYLWLNERIGVRFEDQTVGSTTPFGELQMRSQNDMFGPQFGAKSILQFAPRRFRLVSDARVALLNNDTRHEAAVVTPQVVAGVPSATEVDRVTGRYFNSQLSVAFDGSATAEFFVSQYVTFFAGYQILYVDRVQRATRQFASDLTAFAQTKKSDDHLFYYGPKLGFVMVW